MSVDPETNDPESIRRVSQEARIASGINYYFEVSVPGLNWLLHDRLHHQRGPADDLKWLVDNGIRALQACPAEIDSVFARKPRPRPHDAEISRDAQAAHLKYTLHILWYKAYEASQELRLFHLLALKDGPSDPVLPSQKTDASSLFAELTEFIVGALRHDARRLAADPTDPETTPMERRIALALYLKGFLEEAHTEALQRDNSGEFALFLTAFDGVLDFLEKDILNSEQKKVVEVFTILKGTLDTCAEVLGLDSMSFFEAAEAYAEQVCRIHLGDRQVKALVVEGVGPGLSFKVVVPKKRKGPADPGFYSLFRCDQIAGNGATSPESLQYMKPKKQEHKSQYEMFETRLERQYVLILLGIMGYTCPYWVTFKQNKKA
jgi:hypothetical protein